MRHRAKRNYGVALLAVTLSLTGTVFSPAEEPKPGEVEAEIDVGVAANLAKKAMKAGQPIKALTVLVDAVEKYPGSIGALKKYYDFLLENRIKLTDEERAAVMGYIRTKWPQAKSLEDVFLPVLSDGEVEAPLAHLAGDASESNEAFNQIESLLHRDDIRTAAFYFYVAAAHPDKAVAPRARLGIAEVLLRRGDYKAAEMEFVWFPVGRSVPTELQLKHAVGLASCRERLGKIEEAIRDYEGIWRRWPDSEAGFYAAEGIARIRNAQGNSVAAFSWCQTIRSANPSHTFRDARLGQLYTDEISSVRKYAGTLASSMRESLESKAGVTREPADREMEGLLTFLGSAVEDSADESQASRSSKVKARGLMAASSGVLELLRDPEAMLAKAEDLGQVAQSLWLSRGPEPKSELDSILLRANDAVIASSLAEALTAHAADGRNAGRLASAYLYFALTRPQTCRAEFDALVSSLSRDMSGISETCSSREFREQVASVLRSAGLRGQAKAGHRALLEQDGASADDARSMSTLADKALASGNMDLAVAALERIESEYGENFEPADVTYPLAEAYFQNEDFQKAKAAFARYIAMNPKDEARRMEAEYLSGMCDLYSKDYRQAAMNLFGFAQKHPDHGSTPNAIHLALVSCSEYAQARELSLDERRKFLVEMTTTFPGSEMAAEAHYHLGSLTVDADKNYAEALQHFQVALGGRRSDEAALWIAECHEKLGDLDEAQKWYRKVIMESRYDGPRERAKEVLRTLGSSAPEDER
jgi:TolA-binding protein